MATYDRLDKTGLRRFWDGIKAKLAEKAKITLTGVDPGTGATLASGEYVAVYGEPSQIQTSDIADSAVTTAKLANGSVTTDKLASSSVTSDKIDFTTFQQGTDANGWTVSLGADGKRIWKKRGQTQITVAGGAWGSIVLSSLPVNLPSTFYLTSSVYGDDNAISLSVGTTSLSNTARLGLGYRNHYSGSVTTYVTWSVVIFEGGN